MVTARGLGGNEGIIVMVCQCVPSELVYVTRSTASTAPPATDANALTCAPPPTTMGWLCKRRAGGRLARSEPAAEGSAARAERPRRVQRAIRGGRARAPHRIAAGGGETSQALRATAPSGIDPGGRDRAGGTVAVTAAVTATAAY